MATRAWPARVVLSALQQRVARIIADLPEAEDFALAGGAALVLARVVERETRDLDYFGPSADDVDALLGAVEAAALAAGLDCRPERVSHARLAISNGAETTEVDLATAPGSGRQRLAASVQQWQEILSGLGTPRIEPGPGMSL